MTTKLLNIIRPGLLPLAFAILIACFASINTFTNIFPSAEQIADYARTWYDTYGLLTLVGVGFIESLFMLGLYFPGSFIIVTLVFIAPKTPATLFSIIIGGWLTFTFTSIINFLLGRYGFYKFFSWVGGEKQIRSMNQFFDRWGSLAIFLLAINPTYLAILLICAGIGRFSFSKTLLVATFSLLFWTSIWTIAIAHFSSQIDLNQQGPMLDWILAAIFTLWGAGQIIWHRRKQYLRNKRLD